ncbi:hypothetical protein LCGC14_1265490 [marine sediment metagenome]|uniref:Uncharacterized protein n=1 Tax=marine sediment metagenome TaxID=412755 RepID=A0A0F9L1V4_9ZZZZ
MEPLSDGEYIKALEEAVRILRQSTYPLWHFQDDNMPSYPFDWPDPEVEIEVVPNAKEQ